LTCNIPSAREILLFVRNGFFEMIFSHSKLSCFEQCPRKYKYRYVDEIETEMRESIEAFLGKRVHEALEKVYRDAQKSRTSSPEEVAEFFNSRWETRVRKRKNAGE
jgi:CRISPR/Cas system-associated exonuclease Cas4 (RecB family)